MSIYDYSEEALESLYDIVDSYYSPIKPNCHIMNVIGLKQICQLSSLPSGRYEGEISGDTFYFSIGEVRYEAKLDDTAKGLQIPAALIVQNGEVLIEE